MNCVLLICQFLSDVSPFHFLHDGYTPKLCTIVLVYEVGLFNRYIALVDIYSDPIGMKYFSIAGPLCMGSHRPT